MNLRIFVSSSCIATIYMSIYAGESRNPQTEDWLMVDALALRPSQKQLILQAAKLHNFDRIIDFSSQREEGASVRPGTLKQLTRVWKTKPVFKQVYDFLYGFKLKKEEQDLKDRILGEIETSQQEFSEVDLHMQPVLHLNNSLKKIFSKAGVHYFEHGLGDYLDVYSRIQTGDEFYALFGDAFRNFLAAQNQPSDFVKTPFGSDAFLKAANRFPEVFPQLSAETAFSQVDKKGILILTQSLEEFRVKPEFWDHFLELCLQQIPDPQQNVFLIKPHPRQSPEILDRIKSWLDTRNLSYQMLDDPLVRSMSIEILFGKWRDRIESVFSPFSSGVFYLSKLYGATESNARGPGFYYSFRALKGFTSQTPELYIRRWENTAVYIRNVFGEGVKEL